VNYLLFELAASLRARMGISRKRAKFEMRKIPDFRAAIYREMTVFLNDDEES
jgi:hypothetical protein